MPIPNQVVFVPGFGASSLTYRGGFGGATTYWFNPPILASTNPLSGALGTNGVDPYPVVGKSMSVSGLSTLAPYSGMLTALEQGGYNPVVWNYDWRLSANSLAAAFALFLSTANLSNPFQVVAHSFGGVIAQLAYTRYLTLAPSRTWKQTVYLGTPHGGSYWSAAALAGWFPAGSELPNLDRIFNTLSPVVAALKSSVVTAAQIALGQLLGSWPGLYCLLPNPGGPWIGDDANATSLSLIGNYSDTWGGQQSQWFALGQQVQGAIVTGLSTPRPKETCFVGNGFSTLSDYNGPGNNPGLLNSYSNSDGDQTVTNHRASLDALAAQIDFEQTAHNQLCTSQECIAALLGALFVTPEGNATVTLPPLTTIESPQPPAALNRPSVPYPFNNLHSDP
jgi:pimeloyl-ACP methyl ester carboxylesterase